MPGGGGGADLDVITAGAGDILAGKVIVDKEGNPLTGTMANQGAKTAALNCGGSYTIPAGYHNGSGKVTANSLASQTSATAAAGNILSGKTAWVNGSKITGTIASQGALTLNPGTTAKTGSVSGKYMTGNITVPAISIAAANIKKGVKITFPDGSSVTGTFEGYVLGNGEIYKLGTVGSGGGFQPIPYGPSGVSPAYYSSVCTMVMDTQSIRLYNGYYVGIRTKSPIDLTSWNKLSFEISSAKSASLTATLVGVSSTAMSCLYDYFTTANWTNDLTSDNFGKAVPANEKTTITKDISYIYGSKYICIGWGSDLDSKMPECRIHRIWLSQ